MSDGLAFRRAGHALAPIDDAARAWLEKRKDGDAVIIEPIQVVNAERRALYHVLCEIVAENHQDLTSKQAVDEALRHLCGHFEVFSYLQPDGRRRFMQRSKTLKWAKMKEPEFESFLDRALEQINSVLLPGVDVDELRKQAYTRSGYKPKSNKSAR